MRPAVVIGVAEDAVSASAGEALGADETVCAGAVGVADGDAEADAKADGADSAPGVPVTDVFWLLHPSSRLSDRTVPAASVVAVDRIGLIPL
ncbi:hypothetical protein C173_00255 [Paenibacillus sp. FSL R7-277]|uniref:hypothetical protein n=1 Tax=unclassified Paenibacillus TaxID=185978 RepID=UPI0003E25860|nr:hypothetical protein [Paenibacillus sp. FSL R7-277]ETT80050.1 hypothetical protein C173_00255 [Paenibacillus sp. FSL R7-277]OMF93807.1 hypothetical protein BK146_18345 [Paenibacillus sp. FSL R7-0333]